MGRLLTVLAVVALFAAAALATTNPTPGLQVIACAEDPPGSGIWWYQFYACVGDFQANDLHLVLTGGEIGEGTVITGCFAPLLPGFSCSTTATTADFSFPLVGPFTCTPGISGQYYGIWLSTPDASTIVVETWTLDGDPMASYTSLIACPPPTGTESSTWGQVKTLFR